MQSDASRESAQFLREQLRIRTWSRADFARALSAAAGRTIGQNSTNRWFDDAAPVQPTWPSVQLIARALEMPFDDVRVALGYRTPDEPPRPPTDAWVLESERRSRQLLNVLERVPEDARAGVGVTVDAFLGSFAEGIDRLNASRR